MCCMIYAARHKFQFGDLNAEKEDRLTEVAVFKSAGFEIRWWSKNSESGRSALRRVS